MGQLAFVHDVVKFFRANPQAFFFLVICAVLGLVAFLVVVFGVIAAGSTTPTGEPEGLITALHLLAA